MSVFIVQYLSVLVAVAVVVVSVSIAVDDDDSVGVSSSAEYGSDVDKPAAGLLTVQIPGTPVKRLIDPHGTWTAFMRHSERTNRQHRAKNARKTKQLNGLRGPTGPQGPRGPPGPPGAQVTRDVLFAEFRDAVREAAERKAQSIVDAECAGCKPSSFENITATSGRYLPPLFEVDEAFVVPKIIWGFHCRLHDDRKIPRRTRVELAGLYVPFVDGGFQRGDGIDADIGRFSVQRDGIYNFIVNLQLKRRKSNNKMILAAAAAATTMVKRREGTERRTVRAMVCIDSSCLTNGSLESIIEVDDALPRWHGTLSFTGLLQLRKGQYVSVYVDNDSNETIHVLETSFFGGSLAGL